MSVCVFLNVYSFSIFERQNEGKAEREIFYLMVCSLNAYNTYGWIRSKIEAWNSIWASRRGVRFLFI